MKFFSQTGLSNQGNPSGHDSLSGCLSDTSCALQKLQEAMSSILIFSGTSRSAVRTQSHSQALGYIEQLIKSTTSAQSVVYSRPNLGK